MADHVNPPAFPVAELRDADGCGIREGSDGMSLRDYFAGQALAGMMASARITGDLDINKVRAHDCYLIADAMIAERAIPS